MERRPRSKKSINKVLPSEIVSEILTCLPTESVLECKSVCKTWKNLIHHPSFSQRHLARLNHPDSTDSGKLRYVSLDLKYDQTYYDGLQFYYFEYKEDWNYVKPVHKKIHLKTTSECWENVLIGSINGLICVYGYESEGPAIILNPVTREFVVLPARYPTHFACGFGHLSGSNEYKVVRLSTPANKDGFVEVEVYTLGSGKGWRHVGEFDLGCPSYTIPTQEQHGVFMNECLYWRNNEGSYNTKGGMVFVFDLAKEKFREPIIPQPPLHSPMFDSKIAMGVSGGGILYYAVHQSVEGNEFDEVWLLMKKKNDEHVMKEHQSWGWIKATSLDQKKPFAFWESCCGCGTVIRYDQGRFKTIHSSASTWESLENFGNISRQVFPHKHTLVSLKELGEEDVQTMISHGIVDTYSSDRGESSENESWSD